MSNGNSMQQSAESSPSSGSPSSGSPLSGSPLSGSPPSSAAAQSSAATVGTVAPLPNPSTGSANPSASLPALWSYLEPALDYIVSAPTNNPDKAPAIDVSYHMGVHTAVYNYFTTQSEQAPPPRDPSKAPARPSGTDLYTRLDRYYAAAAGELFLGAPQDDAALVLYLVPCFRRYAAGAHAVNRLLNYVNRHYVKRAVDEDKGWLRLADVLDAVAPTIRADDTREKLRARFRERRNAELSKWGYTDGDPPALLAEAEANAEAASEADRVVSLSALAFRRFRMEFIEPLLAVPKGQGKKKRPPPSADGARAQPKGRLARAVKELLEAQGDGGDERRLLAGELAVVLRTVGIRADHPLRKKLDRYVAVRT